MSWLKDGRFLGTAAAYDYDDAEWSDLSEDSGHLIDRFASLEARQIVNDGLLYDYQGTRENIYFLDQLVTAFSDNIERRRTPYDEGLFSPPTDPERAYAAARLRYELLSEVGEERLVKRLKCS